MTDCAFISKGSLPVVAVCFLHIGVTMVDYEASHAVAAAIGSFAGYCYTNAWRACQKRPLHDEELVEGWLLLETPTWMLVLEHSWIERLGRTIIDPSLVLLLSREDLSLSAYFPSMRYPCIQMQQVLCGELPLVHNQVHGVPGYAQAYQSALAHALTSPLGVRVIPAALSAIAGESLALLFSLLLSAEDRRSFA